MLLITKTTIYDVDVNLNNGFNNIIINVSSTKINNFFSFRETLFEMSESLSVDFLLQKKQQYLIIQEDQLCRR